MFGLTSPSKTTDPWPLRFKRHNFDAYCYNTQRCSIIYNKFQFSLFVLEPSPAPVGDYKSRWSGTNIIGDQFAKPVRVEWIALDGSEHRAEVDLAELFKDRLVRHNVPREDIPEGWLAAKAVNPVPVEILMEVNDHTISVYMKAHVATKSLRVPDNDFSNYRNDLIQVWTHTY